VAFEIETIGEHPGMGVWVLFGNRDTGEGYLHRATHLVKIAEDNGGCYSFAFLGTDELQFIAPKGLVLIEVSWDLERIYSAVGLEEIRDEGVARWGVKGEDGKPVDWVALRGKS
jgi:hypothetical protein